MAVAFWQAEMGARRWRGVSRVNGEGRKSQEAVQRWAPGGELKADVGNRLVVRAQWQVRLERAVGATEGPGAEEWQKLDPFFRKSNMAVGDVGGRLVRRSVRWWWQTRWGGMKFSSEKGQWKEETDSQSHCGNKSRGLRTSSGCRGMQQNHGTSKLF